MSIRLSLYPSPYLHQPYILPTLKKELECFLLFLGFVPPSIWSTLISSFYLVTSDPSAVALPYTAVTTTRSESLSKGLEVDTLNSVQEKTRLLSVGCQMKGFEPHLVHTKRHLRF